MDDVGILRISRSESKDIEAVGVVFEIRVEGEKFLLGNAALQNSQVVRNLVTGLKAFGAKDEDFLVKSVNSRSSNGKFGHNTKAIYNILLRLEDLKKVGDYFGYISAQGGSISSEIQWIYDYGNLADELACKALVSAKEAATQMVESIGYRVAGIKTCSDGTPEYEEMRPHYYQGDIRARIAYASVTNETADLGTEYRAQQRVRQRIDVEFMIAPAA